MLIGKCWVKLGKDKLLNIDRRKKYYLKKDYSHYDIVVETFNNYKIYIEVKSTKSKFGNKIQFFIRINCFLVKKIFLFCKYSCIHHF